MRYSCILNTPHKAEDMERIFATEIDRQHKRSKLSIEEDDGKAVFRIDAEDPTALRATIMAITQIIKTWENTQEAI